MVAARDKIITNHDVNRPARKLSAKPRSITICLNPANKWKNRLANIIRSTTFGNGEFNDTFNSSKLLGDRSELPSRHNNIGMDKKSTTPEIRCNIDAIAGIGNFSVNKFKLTGRSLSIVIHLDKIRKSIALG